MTSDFLQSIQVISAVIPSFQFNPALRAWQILIIELMFKNPDHGKSA